MNGLRFIRTQCNFSLNELADVLGITRQALSSWETNQKPMPEKRREQLSEFFGVDARYLGDIAEKDIQELRDKVMFSYVIEEKEIRLYRPKSGTKTLDRLYMTFADDSETTLDERYARAKKRKQATLDKADEIIRYHDRCKYIQDKTNVINTRCRIYDALNTLMDEIAVKPILKRMPFFHEIEAGLYAMLLAYGLISENDVRELYAHSVDELYDETAWILSLAKDMNAHWAAKDRRCDEIDREIQEDKKAQREQQVSQPESQSLEEQIREYEDFCKEMRKQHGYE